jgi:hypothetical protein
MLRKKHLNMNSSDYVIYDSKNEVIKIELEKLKFCFWQSKREKFKPFIEMLDSNNINFSEYQNHIKGYKYTHVIINMIKLDSRMQSFLCNKFINIAEN